MRFTTRLASKALVWLSAALLPVQTAYPATCGCERPVQHAKGHGSATPPTHCGHSGCCHNGRVSECCAALASVRSSCCGSRTATACEPESASGSCHCAPQEPPTPAPTRSDNSSSAKEVLCHGTLAVASLAVVRPQMDNPLAPSDFAALPATSLQRLSALCRFLI